MKKICMFMYSIPTTRCVSANIQLGVCSLLTNKTGQTDSSTQSHAQAAANYIRYFVFDYIVNLSHLSRSSLFSPFPAFSTLFLFEDGASAVVPVGKGEAAPWLALSSSYAGLSALWAWSSFTMSSPSASPFITSGWWRSVWGWLTLPMRHNIVYLVCLLCMQCHVV